jgi:hypothetical protein
LLVLAQSKLQGVTQACREQVLAATRNVRQRAAIVTAAVELEIQASSFREESFKAKLERGEKKVPECYNVCTHKILYTARSMGSVLHVHLVS